MQTHLASSFLVNRSTASMIIIRRRCQFNSRLVKFPKTYSALFLNSVGVAAGMAMISVKARLRAGLGR